MIEITTSNSTKVNELLFAFGNLRDEVMVITMTTPTLSPFHQKIFTHAKFAKASMQERFSKFPFLKFHIPRVSASRNRGAHFEFTNQIIPFSLNPLTPRRPTAAFTLIELLAVITVIGILAGLTLGAAGAVRRHGATSTAKAEVAALQAACDRYYADYNSYPTTTNSMPDPSSGYSPSTSTYTNAGQVLFFNLVGSAKLSVAPASKRYFEPKPAMVNTTPSTNILIDPWGYIYGYNSDGTNAPLIWSTAGQTTGGANTNKWITSWPKM
jgi:prepilin-type N-terminal cleavage/methylation domain-containing protein